MASRNSFLDAPSFRRITPPSQRRSISRRRSSGGFAGSGSSRDPIRRLTEQERRERRLKNLQSELSDSGTRLTKSEREAILSGKSVSSVRERINERQRQSSLRSFQRDLTRRGVQLTREEASLIESGASASAVRSQVSSRLGRRFAGSSGQAFVRARGQNIAVSQGFAELVQERQEQGGFRRAEERRREREVTGFAREAGLGGVSLAGGGAAVVTSRGETVGGVSTAAGPALVTSSGRDVTPRIPLDVVRAAPQSGFVRAAGSIGRRVGGQQGSATAQEFASGFEAGVARPISTLRRTRQTVRGPARGQGTTAFVAGEASGLLGSFGVGFAGGAVTRGVGAAARPLLSRALPAGRSLPAWATGQAARTAGGVALGGALTAPAAIDVSRLPTRRQREAGFADLAGQLTVTGAGFARGFGSARASRVGGRVGSAVDEAVPRFGTPSALSRSSPFQAAQFQVTRALPRPSSRFTTGTSGYTRSARAYLVSGGRGFAVPGGGRQQQLQFTSSPPVTQRVRPIPRQITSDAALLIARQQAQRPPTTFAVQQGFSSGDLSNVGRFTRTPPSLSRNQLRRLLGRRELGRRGAGLPDWVGSAARGRDSFVDSVQLPAVLDQGRSASLSRFGLGVTRRPRRPSPVIPDEPGTSQFGIRTLVTDRGRIFSPLSRTRQRPSSRSKSSAFDGLVFADPTAGVATTIGRSIDRYGSISSLRRTIRPRFSQASPRRTTTRAARGARAARAPRSSSFLAGFVGGAAGTALRTQQAFQASTQQLVPQLQGQRQSQGFRLDVDLSPRFDTGLRTSQITTPQTRTPSRPLLTPPRTGGGPGGPARPGSPGVPPGLPGFNIPTFGFTPLSAQQGSGTRRQERYTPSLVAQFLDIEGERPSRSLTGLEIRPITFGN